MQAYFTNSELENSERLAVCWIIHAINKSGKGGVSHSRNLLLPAFMGWKDAYPETTGYVIENLCHFNQKLDLHSFDFGIKAADWLCNIQHPDGWWGKGTDNVSESFFNTAQILFGLYTAFEKTNENKYFISLQKAYQRLIFLLQNDTYFNESLYCKSYLASYYARAYWPLLLVDKKYFNSIASTLIFQHISSLLKLKKTDLGFSNSGFFPGADFLSHTIAYTYEGFFEIARLQQDKSLLNLIYDELLLWANKSINEKNIYGSYNHNYAPNHSYITTTGQAQFAALFCKAYLINPKKELLESASFLISKLMHSQYINAKKDFLGAFPASLPVYKNYFPFRIVNWTNKFFLDACHYYKKAAAIE